MRTTALSICLLVASCGFGLDGESDVAPPEVDAPESVTAIDLVDDGYPIGVTNDGYLIYTRRDGQGTSLEAMPVAGGVARSIARDLPAATHVHIRGSVVGWYTGGDLASAGRLHLWTAAHGAKENVGYARWIWLRASDDGTRVLYGRGDPHRITEVVFAATTAPDVPLARFVATSPGAPLCVMTGAVTSRDEAVLSIDDGVRARLFHATATGIVRQLADTATEIQPDEPCWGVENPLLVDRYGAYAVSGDTLVSLAEVSIKQLETPGLFTFTRDGTALIYTTLTALRRLDIGAPAPNTLLDRAYNIQHVDSYEDATRLVVCPFYDGTAESIRPCLVIDDDGAIHDILPKDVYRAMLTPEHRMVHSLFDHQRSLYLRTSSGGRRELFERTNYHILYPWSYPAGYRRPDLEGNVRTIGENVVVTIDQELWFANVELGVSQRIADKVLFANSFDSSVYATAAGKRLFFTAEIEGRVILRAVDLP
jgi:hypothetical protein